MPSAEHESLGIFEIPFEASEIVSLWGGRVGPSKQWLTLGLFIVFGFLSAPVAKADEMLFEDSLLEAMDIINQVQLRDQTIYSINGIPVAQKCLSFLSEDEVLGSNGNRIYQSFIKLAPSLPNLVEGDSLNKLCPKYKNMKIQEKGLVWVLILTMVAHFESSCDSSKATQGPNGTASGYYQLHQNKEAKYDGKLSVCQKGSSNDVSTVHQCTLAMMQYQFQHQNGLLFSPDSYWDVLRPNGKSQKASHIRASLQRIRLCNPTTT